MKFFFSSIFLIFLYLGRFAQNEKRFLWSAQVASEGIRSGKCQIRGGDPQSLSEKRQTRA